MAELLERAPLLAALAQELAQVRGGAGRIVLVAGEAGVGKSALLERYLASIRTDCEVVSGACDALFTPRPLGPLRDVALQWNDAALLDAQGDRHTLLTVFLQRLRERRAPVVVAFEDMHWADEATLDVVKFVGRRIAGLPVLFILTYRDDETGPLHPLRAVLGDLPRASTTRIWVQRLSEVSVMQLARSKLGDGDHGELYALTGGNPFFVTEVLAGGGARISATLRDAVLARASRLSQSAREALDLAALAPGAVEGWLIEQCMQGEEGAIDECVACGMLAPVDARYAFRHELARLAVRDELPPQRRRVLGRRLLNALESSPPGPELAARLAHHAEDAGDGDAVIKYASAAGHSAASLGSHREACAHFKRAIAHADAMPERERALLLEALAQECHSTGDVTTAIDSRRKAAMLWRELGDARKGAENLAKSVTSLIGAGRDSEAEVASRDAIAMLEPLPAGPELGIAYRVQAAVRMLQRDNAEAIAWGEKSLAAGEAFADVETQVSALNSIGSALIVSGDEGRGSATLEQALALAREAGLEVQVGHALGNLGSGLGEVYRFDLADRYLAEAIRFATERDIDNTRQYARSWQANTHLHQGRWSEAAEAALDVLNASAVVTNSRTMALLALGRLRARRGDSGVWDVLDEALALADRSGTLQRKAPVHAARAEAAWLEDDAERACAEALAAYPLALQKAHAWFTGELAYWQWKAGMLKDVPAVCAEPYSLQMRHAAIDAHAAWQARRCPYEAARALVEIDSEDALKGALQVFDRLGAAPAADRVRRRLRELGTSSIPRGPRAAARGNAFGLTARELEVVALVAQGLTNGAIAARLHRSEKTVDHP